MAFMTMKNTTENTVTDKKRASMLLIDEPALQVLPSLALHFGLDEAIVLQQLHYWLCKAQDSPEGWAKNSLRDGRYWVFNTYEQWQKQFPFWSISTIKRIFSRLENNWVVHSQQFDKRWGKQRKYYTIDYDHLLEHLKVAPSDESDRHPQEGHNDPTEVINLTGASGLICSDHKAESKKAENKKTEIYKTEIYSYSYITPKQFGASVSELSSQPSNEDQWDQDDLLEIYDSYPLQRNRKAALLAIDKALQEISNGDPMAKPKHWERSWPPANPVVWLCSRVKEYAVSVRASDPDYIKQPQNWFRDGCYTDDEQVWDVQDYIEEEQMEDLELGEHTAVDF